jgi:cell division transport system permease protein
MRQLQYFISEALAGLWRGRRATLMAVMTSATAFFVLGAFLLVTSHLDRAAVAWRAAAEMSVFLRDGISIADRQEVERLLAASPVVAARAYVTKDEARRRFKQFFPDLAVAAADLPDNPFPASFEVRVLAATASEEAVSTLVRQVERQAGVADVQYDRRWLARLAAATSVVRWVGVILAAILCAAAALTVASVVRLALYARRDEIEIMRLVGAPLPFIRGPFVTEGTIEGGAGAVVALAALVVAFWAVRAEYGAAVAAADGGTPIKFLSPGTVLLLLLGGMTVGCIGGLVAARSVR